MKSIAILTDNVFEFALFEQGKEGHVGKSGFGPGEVAVGDVPTLVQAGPDPVWAPVIRVSKLIDTWLRQLMDQNIPRASFLVKISFHHFS